MKKIFALILAAVMLASLSAALTAADAPAFTDIAGHWAEATIEKYKDAGIVNGYPDGTFKPDNTVSRAELAKIITLAFGLTEKSEITYNDLDTSAWYYPYLETAVAYIPVYSPPDLVDTVRPYAKNDASGRKGFLPHEPTLRVHAAETLSLLKMRHTDTTVEFPDNWTLLEEVNEMFEDGWYDIYIKFRPSDPEPGNQVRLFRYSWLANKLNIMNGFPDGNFYPYGCLTRAEVLTVIDRILSE